MKNECPKDVDIFLEKDKLHIKSLIERYGIRNKDILSIGSGGCDEEYLFSLYGNNTVDCVDPAFGNFHEDLNICSQEKESQDALNRLNKFQQNIHEYQTGKIYDVIYSNSPGDWMNNESCITTPDNPIPESYLKMFNDFGKKDCVVIVQMRGGFFNQDILQNPLFPTEIVKRIEENTNYMVEEMWIDAESFLRFIFVAVRGLFIKKDIPIEQVELMSKPFKQIKTPHDQTL